MINQDYIQVFVRNLCLHSTENRYCSFPFLVNIINSTFCHFILFTQLSLREPTPVTIIIDQGDRLFRGQKVMRSHLRSWWLNSLASNSYIVSRIQFTHARIDGSHVMVNLLENENVILIQRTRGGGCQEQGTLLIEWLTGNAHTAEALV